jgi:hypothetical protein
MAHQCCEPLASVPEFGRRKGYTLGDNVRGEGMDGILASYGLCPVVE